MGWVDADGPDPGIPLLFPAPLLGRLCVVAGDVDLWDDGAMDPRSMGASVDMGLAKAFPLRADQVGGGAQGPSLVAFGDAGEERPGLARLGQVAQVVQGSPRSCHVGSLESLRSRWRCRSGGLGGIHSGAGSRTSEQSSPKNKVPRFVPPEGTFGNLAAVAQLLQFLVV